MIRRPCPTCPFAAAARLALAWLLAGAAHAAAAQGAAGTAEVAQAASAPGYRAPTETPAAHQGPAARAPLLAVARAGQRMVAAGLRGRIVFSDDAGQTWTQAQVPVETDLVAIHFATPTHGFAVGHRGVVLESNDAGAHWVRRFAGQQLNEVAQRFYQAQNPTPDSAAAKALAGASRAIEQDSVPSLLDVWFESERSGTLVGTFNTIFRTEDGGRTWVPCMERTDNPEELHFYAVRGGPGGVFLAGERGGVWRLDASSSRWLAVPTGYGGTLFGLLVDGPRVLAYGMRGSLLASDDAGRQWRTIATPRKVGLVAGVKLRGGELLLADQAGGWLRSRDGGRSFAAVDAKAHTVSFALAEGAAGELVSAGPGGVAVLPDLVR
ncbi:WD40/YVTN/BNR-like repeat-containing protein [Piscinibacter sp.]|uniref:WD40/YVTN/BNR-like repeat-containing protein n=1 Tax=Piscinibacter sp. TaxID=1903157 RepID=UPI0039E49DFC